MPQTSLGFPYPGLNDQPNPPAHIQALATAVDTYISGNLTSSNFILLGRSAQYTLLDDGNQHPINGWMDGTLFSTGGMKYAGNGLVQVPNDGLYVYAFEVEWPSIAAAGNYKRVGTLWQTRSDGSIGEQHITGVEDNLPHPGFLGKSVDFITSGPHDTQAVVYWGATQMGKNDVCQAALLQNSGGAQIVYATRFLVGQLA